MDKDKVYVDFEEEDKFGNKTRTKGIFTLVKESDDYIIISSEKNTIQVSRKDIRKFKKSNQR